MTLGLAVNFFTAVGLIAAGYFISIKPDFWLKQTRLRAIMSLGAGFLTTIVFFELLPLATHEMSGDFRRVLFWVLIGSASVFIFDRWVSPYLTFLDNHQHEDDGCAHHHEYEHDHGHDHASVTGPTPQHAHAACGHAILGHGAACSAIGCLIVCSFFDGIAFSGAMTHDRALGALIFMGQIFHVLPEGLIASSLVLAADGTPRAAKKVAITIGVCFFIGALIPAFLPLLPGMAALHAFFLPISSGILLYVAFSQLLPATSGSKFDSFMVLIGGFVFAVLHTLVGHSH